MISPRLGHRRAIAITGVVALLSGMLTPGAANASLRMVEQAYELHLDQIVLPDTLGGSVIVRPCAGCRPITLATTPSSRFLLRGNSAPLALAAFAKAVDAARRRSKPMIYVYYTPDTRRINRIVLGKGPGK